MALGALEAIKAQGMERQDQGLRRQRQQGGLRRDQGRRDVRHGAAAQLSGRCLHGARCLRPDNDRLVPTKILAPTAPVTPENGRDLGEAVLVVNRPSRRNRAAADRARRSRIADPAAIAPGYGTGRGPGTRAGRCRIVGCARAHRADPPPAARRRRAWLSDVFLTPRNLLNILWAVSILGIVALGQTMLLITCNFDMSVASVVGLAGIITVLRADRRARARDVDGARPRRRPRGRPRQRPPRRGTRAPTRS